MICFHTVASEKWGIGNLKRMHLLAEKFLLSNIKFDFFVLSDSEINEELFYPWMRVYYDSNMLIEGIQQYINEYDYFIIDLPFLSEETIGFYNKYTNNNLITLNDYGVELLKPTLFFNGDALKSINFNCKMYRGIDYQIIDCQLKEHRPLTLKKINNIRKVGLIFGGADPGNYLEYLMEEEIDKYFEYIFILGPGISQQRRNFLKVKLEAFGYTYRDNPNIYNIFKEVDVVVALGGATAYEAMFLGVPIINVGYKHMKSYATYLKELGVASYVENIKNLTDFLNDHSNIDDIVRKRNCAFDFVDGKGIDRIYNVIVKECNI